jgi:hypothetical protein
MAANLRDAFLGRGVPVTSVFSTGNEVSVCVEDVLAHYIADAQTRVIAVYAEQIRRPRTFLKLAAQARDAAKPLVLLMPGRSARAREAAQSHTVPWRATMPRPRRCCSARPWWPWITLDELLDAAAVLLRYPQPPAGGTAFMTGSGAMKNIALDFAADLGLDLPALTPATTQRLSALLLPTRWRKTRSTTRAIGVRQPGLNRRSAARDAVRCARWQPRPGHPGRPEMAQRDKAEFIVPALGPRDQARRCWC